MVNQKTAVHKSGWVTWVGREACGHCIWAPAADMVNLAVSQTEEIQAVKRSREHQQVAGFPVESGGEKQPQVTPS